VSNMEGLSCMLLWGSEFCAVDMKPLSVTVGREGAPSKIDAPESCWTTGQLLAPDLVAS
jgi:hypothetical protein